MQLSVVLGYVQNVQFIISCVFKDEKLLEHAKIKKLYISITIGHMQYYEKIVLQVQRHHIWKLKRESQDKMTVYTSTIH